MHAGIEILLERMKTHPEEFYMASRWCQLVDNFYLFLTEDDKKAFEDGIAECRKAELTEIILNRLVVEAKEDKEALGKRVIPMHPSTNPYSNSVLYNAETDQYRVGVTGIISDPHMQAHQQYLQAHNSALNQIAGQRATQTTQSQEDSMRSSLMQSLKKTFL